MKQLDHLASEVPTDSITKELLRTQEVLNQKTSKYFSNSDNSNLHLEKKKRQILGKPTKAENCQSIITYIMDQSGNINQNPSEIN